MYPTIVAVHFDWWPSVKCVRSVPSTCHLQLFSIPTLLLFFPVLHVRLLHIDFPGAILISRFKIKTRASPLSVRHQAAVP